MSSKVRVLLVSVHGYGSNYLNEFKAGIENAVIEGIVTLMKEEAEADSFIKENRIPVYYTLEEFYKEHKADLAVISTPIHFHTEHVTMCLNKGSNVLCEKPLCLTLKEALEMQKTADAKGLFLAVGYQRCYQKDVLTVKEEILSGALGAPKRFKSIQGSRRGMNYYNRNNWAGKIKADGREVFDSPFQNAFAHEFELMTFLLGDRLDTGCRIESVDAKLYRANPNIENFDIAALIAMTDKKVPLYYYTAHPISEANWETEGIYEFEKGTVVFYKKPGDIERFFIKYPDGKVRNVTGEVGNDAQIKKLYVAIQGCISGQRPVCTVYAELAHIEAVRMLKEQPVKVISPDKINILKEGNDCFYCVSGLHEKMREAFDAWRLPCRIGE